MSESVQAETVDKQQVYNDLNDAVDTNQYVTFLIGSEVYGVEVLRVQEIIGMTRVTQVPNSMHFMKGVINLRGTVVPVVDMRLRFTMEEKDYDNFTVILIVEVKGTMIGMIVDSVSDVVNIPVKDIQDTPHFSASIRTDYIKGIGRIEEDLVIVLDVDKILSHEEIEKIEQGTLKQ
ncbi:MAG TPA: chemotaxis protein CheW [Spirochaetota bacterium]|nr:chemotaxis protein CheW [Spirochaetota bacterium]